MVDEKVKSEIVRRIMTPPAISLVHWWGSPARGVWAAADQLCLQDPVARGSGPAYRSAVSDHVAAASKFSVRAASRRFSPYGLC